MFLPSEQTDGDLPLIVALFEDEDYASFFPLSYTRPVFMLRSGMFTTVERSEKLFPKTRLFLFCRDYLVPTVKQRVTHSVNATTKIDDELLLINASVVLNKTALKLINDKITQNVAVTQNQKLLAARLSEQTAKKLEQFKMPMKTPTVKKILKHCRVIKGDELNTFNYLWELVDNSPKMIKDDYRLLEADEKSTHDERVAVYGAESSIHLAKGSRVEAFVTLDARNGPIYVGRNSVVQSGSRIAGPAYVGSETVVASALIHSGCSIGDSCRIGGELEQTIVQGYTNKHHLGYFGHSYIGEWVNIGAGTTNSDLKNTYGTVKVKVNGKPTDTKRIKVGCFIGDHAKISIGAQIYTGKKIGVASHVHGFVTEDVPSFTVWARTMATKPVEVYLTSLIETQKRTFERRNFTQTKQDIDLLKRLFTLTTAERKKAEVVKKQFGFR